MVPAPALPRVSTALVVALVALAVVSGAHAARTVPDTAGRLASRRTVPSPAVVGYWGANANTPALVDVPATYNVIIFAFANINAPDNSLDPVTGGFRLTSPPPDLRAQIKAVKALRPHQRVLFSIGGENDAVEGTSVNFTAAALRNTLAYWGFDGVDLDLETVTDAARLTQIVAMIKGAKAADPSVMVTMAPQTGFSPGAAGTLASLAPSFIYSPLLQGLDNGALVDLVNVQFYNNWPCASTPSACVSAANMEAWAGGLAKAMPGLDARKFVAGFPASRQAATSGYQSPAAMEAFAADVVKPGTVGGMMTWSVEWDMTTGYAWSTAVAKGLGSR